VIKEVFERNDEYCFYKLLFGPHYQMRATKYVFDIRGKIRRALARKCFSAPSFNKLDF
jgi:hypothetical protein